MYIGHFATAFAARAITDESPRLGTLFLAAQAVDWLFFTFAMVGIEKLRIVPGITKMNPLDLYHMPITHSLLGTIAIALVFGAAVYFASRNVVASTWAAIVVASHWFIDLLVHRPDLTLAGGSPKLGFGLWNEPLVAISLELGLILVTFTWYVKRTKGPLVPPLVLLGTMLLFQAINWFGPQPQEAGIAMYLMALVSFGVLTALAFWLDETRWHKNRVGLAVASARR